MKCQFEERQFEQHLNNELCSRPDMLYVPGQVLEGQLGFDAALYSTNRRLWRRFGAPFLFPPFERIWTRRHRPGRELRQEWWAALASALDLFPTFRCNVFLQHKRPERLEGTRAAEWSDWGRPYFRYDLVTHQKQALEKLERQAGKSSLVVYAAPAFATLIELWAAIEARDLVNRSNFCQPSKVADHRRYSFADPGNKGIGHSEPREIVSFDFYEQLRSFPQQAEPIADNMAFLLRLGHQVDAAMEASPGFRNRFDEVVGSLHADPDSALHQAMASISAFNFVVGTRWFVAMDTEEGS